MARILSVPLQSREDGFRLDQAFCSPLAWGVIGFLLGRAVIFGEIWPFGLAYVAAWKTIGRKRLALPLLGVILGLTSCIGFRLSLPYYAALACLSLVPGEGEVKGRYWLIGSCLAIKMLLHYVLQPIPMVFIAAVTECVLAVFVYGPLYYALNHCTSEQLACGELYAFLVSLTLIVSVPLNWGGFSLRLFLICALITLGAKIGGLAVSCILGPALALLALLLGEPSQLVILIVISSLLTGFLHKFRWGYYVGPILALVFSVSGPAEPEVVKWLLVLLLATWAASRVSEERLSLLARIVPGTDPYVKQNRGYDEHLKKVLDQKIDEYLTVFEELENTLLDNENPLFSKQMQGMADLLKTMKTAFSPEAHFTKEFEEKLLNHFARADLSHITVLQNLDGFEVYGAKKKPCVTRCFCQEVADFCSGTIASQRYGVVHSSCAAGGTCGFRIAPCPRYKVEIGKAKVASQEVSGDSQITFEISSSKVAIVLSDGMGVGLKAQTESNVTVRLLERMIKAGYDLATAVSLINRLLMIRNQDDMFVTIDLVVVDLFSGQLEFVKIGAAPSFIKRGREVEIIHNHALPVGVLSQVDVQSDRRTLKEGEVLVMTTDGVLDAQRNIARKDEWMCWNLRRLQTAEDMATVAEDILCDSIEVAEGRIDDDMMVVVARLVRVEWKMETYRRVQSSV